MSKTNGTLDRWLFWAIVLVLLLMVGYISWASARLADRQKELRDQHLNSSQQMLGMRLEGLFTRMDEELLEEAELMRREASGAFVVPLERWLPLLQAEWSIRSIRMADDLGQSMVLHRNTPDAVLASVLMKNDELVAIRTRVSAEGTLSDSSEQIAAHDARRQIWFTKALENPRNEPVWSLGTTDTATSPYLVVSYLVRSAQGDPYRIIAFDIDLTSTPWLDMRSSPLAAMGAFVLDGNGHMFELPNVSRNARIGEAEQRASERWTGAPPGEPFDIVVNDEHYHALLRPFLLNGETLYTGTLLEQELVVQLTASERNTLLAVSLLVSVLITLLCWMWLRRRRADLQLRRQEKVSRSRELKLAQVIGEREVLNREVHHRVKNNLQVVSSLLNLQAMRLADGPVRDEFLRGKQRIDTLALVHHKLYALKDLRSVDLHPFLDSLLEALDSTLHRGNGTVSHELRTASLHTDQDTAIGLGIILCELVINAYQHAFPYITGGHIDIQVQPVDGTLHRMVVKDNGKGMDPSNTQGPGRLGLEIVEAMAEQLDGSVHLHVNGGTTCEVLFRLRPEPRSADAG